jgi:hypothetical protein
MRLRASLSIAFTAALLLAAPFTPIAAQKSGALSGAGASVGAPHRFAWVLEGGLEMGGDVLLEIPFTDGSTQDMLAGQGGTVAFGAEVRGARIGLRATAGLKYNTTAADNANIAFTRVPLEAVLSWYPSTNLRLGGGVSYHTAVHLNGDGFLPDFDADAAMGTTAEIGYKWFAVTYTSLKYEFPGAAPIDASSVGVSLTYLFGKR